MYHNLDDTIVAVASAPGGSARGILRLSGESLFASLEAVFPQQPSQWHGTASRPRWLAAGLPLPGRPRPIACDVLLWPTARSYTRQPLAEVHMLGSPPLLQAAVRSFCQAGARLAEPGEFTLRAFLGGRLDLTQAEAVLGVINAAGEREVDRALEQLAGGLRNRMDRLRDTLLDTLAHLEAGLDFVEDDIEFILPEKLAAALRGCRADVAELIEQSVSRLDASDELRVVLAGAPNVGKSSLFNALSEDAGGRAALVSDIPGTTRDYLSARLELDGVNCRLIDTAGAEAAEAGLAAAAQHHSARQRSSAHLTLFCLDASRPLDDWERAQLAAVSGERLTVLTKCDLPAGTDYPGESIRTSTKTGEGLAELKARLRRCLEESAAEGMLASTAVRCQESLRLAEDSLLRAEELARSGGGEELVAAEIRTTLTELGKVVGAVYTDDILDRIFSRFCIGK